MTAEIVTELFIDGELKPTENKLELIDPVTEKPWLSVSAGSSQDVNQAYEAASRAHKSWREVCARQRGVYLNKLADLVERDADYLIGLETKNTGIAIKETRGFHIPFTIKCLRYFAGWADKIGGKKIPFEGDFICFTEREPIGTITAILPWNFPLMLLAWKLGPALASGNCLLVKPSPYSPLTALHMGKLAQEIGLPKGVFQVLPCLDQDASHFISNPLANKISFTGSVETGKLISRTAAENLTEVGLELGGKSPVVVCEDVDIDQVAKWAHMAIFLNHGQNCCAGSRLYVHESIYDQFVEKCVELARNLRVGNPTDPKTDMGPLINKKQYETVLGFIQQGQKEGGRIIFGGEACEGHGYFVKPTIFVDVDETMAVVKQEIFGPVMCIMKYKSFDEVLKRANQTDYGLAAGIFTNSLQIALTFSKKVTAGTVWVNCYNWTDPASPFGGFKQSGNSRDLSKYAFENYTKVKSTIVNYGSLNLI